MPPSVAFILWHLLSPFKLATKNASKTQRKAPSFSLCLILHGRGLVRGENAECEEKRGLSAGPFTCDSKEDL